MRSVISSSSEEESNFNAQEQDRILKNSNIFKQKANTHISCLKHPNKKAKYYVQHDKRALFCSKCALNLALKGHKIEETSTTELEVQRQMRINQFQELMKQTLIGCNQKILDLNTLQVNSKGLLEDQKVNCIKFFEQVIESAQQLKQTYISKFQNDHQGLEQNILDLQQTVTSYEKQLLQFQIDIERNHANIVKKMEMKPFEEIMSKYERRVQNIKQMLMDMKLENNVKVIAFDSQQILTFMNKMCYNLLLNDTTQTIKSRSNSLNYNNNPSIDLKVFDLLENDDIYQSTFSNTIKDGNSGNPPSPISKLPIYKSNGSNPISTIQNSRRESDHNTPESWNGKNLQAQESHQQSHNVSLNDQVNQNIKIEKTTIQEIIKMASDNNQPQEQQNQDSTPSLHQKSATVLPSQLKLFHSQRNNLPPSKADQIQQYDSNVTNKSLETKNRKKQPSVDQTEQRKFYILNQNPPKQSVQQEDTLKERIFKELSGHSSESVYSQVLKQNNNQQKVVRKGKENNQFDWSSSLRNKQNLILKKQVI